MFKVLKQDGATYARLGVLETPHGSVETPAYVVVGTHAKVRELEAADLIKTETQIVIANTYHLWRRLGESGLADYAGLHKEMSWSRPVMTDSGGFQVFSLGFARELGTGKVADSGQRTANRPDRNLARITDEGVFFLENGQECFLSPEKSIQIQRQLGADIIFAFDEPTSPRHSYEYTKEALARTHRWAERSLKAKSSEQLMFGIVQGGVFEDLRRASAKFIGSLDFDGLAVGGSFGSSFGAGVEGRVFRELDWVAPFLPEDKPRHLLGIGLVEDLFAGVAKGMDTFDCVVPTREGRHGAIYTSRGRLDIKRGIYRADQSVLDEDCACEVCAVKKISKQELGEMFRAKDLTAGHLASFHNVYFFNNLMEKIRVSIKENKFSEFKKEYFDLQRN